MLASRHLHRQSFKTLSSLLQSHAPKFIPPSASTPHQVQSDSDYFSTNSWNLGSSEGVPRSTGSSNVTLGSENACFQSMKRRNCFDGSRAMSTARGRSMRSKVERRMRQESGKTLREIRRAKKIQKKLMTDEERLIYNLRRAKKKVALLLQKLKKYELPELPPPRHDPELLTPEQFQAFKKIGFKNKNYCPVGVRGVFGGVVQNMHLHWKFHETVQVCCDNFPKEKIKEMATMLARLSGGIVINIHNVKTIIMFRGRNYRQPKNLIPVNTLTKRKALFKARFEQALDSQKLNIKKIEQQLRRMGVNPDDPIAMASIQRVASTFFNAIDKKEGSPYVFRGDNHSLSEHSKSFKPPEPSADSDQEELDRFITEIEDAADKEWAEEEAAEKEEIGRIRYLNREDFSGRFRRPEMPRNEHSDEDVGDRRQWKDTRGRQRATDSDDEDGVISEGENEWDSNDLGDASDDSDDTCDKFKVSGLEKNGRSGSDKSFRAPGKVKFKGEAKIEDSGSEDLLSDLENAMWKSGSGSEEESDPRASSGATYDYKSSSGEEEDFHPKERAIGMVSDHESDADDSDEVSDDLLSKINRKKDQIGRAANDNEGWKRKFASVSKDLSSDHESATWESDSEEGPEAYRAAGFDYGNSDEEQNVYTKRDDNDTDCRKPKTSKQRDEDWDSD